MNFCPKCENYLYLQQNFTESTNAKGQKEKNFSLNRVCRTCGYTETDNKGGLINETVVQARKSEGYKILLNEFTRQDPTLPHIKSLSCPNTTGDPAIGKQICPTYTSGKPRDVIYIKHNEKDMKFLYICDVCGEQWRSRS